MSEVIVVGSGPGGVNAAAALVESGISVTLLDYGNTDDKYESLIPALPFSEIRRTDFAQHRYFLGDEFEGVGFEGAESGAWLTPPRQYITRDTDTLLPLASSAFAAFESLARGGLGGGWGAGVFPFDDNDLENMPISRSELDPHYTRVAERIGVCGAHDDLLPFLGECPAMMPPLDIDQGAQKMLLAYGRKRKRLSRAGFHLGVTRLAVCSQPHRGRGPQRYYDMDFWADLDRSVYRPRWSLEELQGQSNFTYSPGRLVLRFVERDDHVEVVSRCGTQEVTERARKLVLAAGTLGTARIVLRSLGGHGDRLPLACNPYTYVPCVRPGMAGEPLSERNHSLAQLTAFYEADGGGGSRLVQAQVYSYRSLLTFKLMRESPLAYRETLGIMRLMMPLFAIVGIHHEDRPTDHKYCALHRTAAGEPDRLEIQYRQTSAVKQRQEADEAQMLRLFRRLGCWPIRRIPTRPGSSVHYAGTLPMTRDECRWTCDAEGRLRGTHSVYIGDGSVFPHLPAKGVTFTLMAHADRVGQRLAHALR